MPLSNMNVLVNGPINAAEARQGRVDLMHHLQIVETLLPAAKHGAQLRACGIQIVATPCAVAALREIGGEDIQWILANVVHADKLTVSTNTMTLAKPWWKFWK